MSRQPPPPGAPSWNDPRTRGGNSYRPREDDHRAPPGDYYDRRDRHYDDYRPRSPPQRPRSPPRMYEFRGNDRHDSRPESDDRRYPARYGDRPYDNSPGHGYGRSDSYHPRDGGFTFRQEAPPSIDFRQADNYRRSPPPQRRRQENGNVRSRGRGGYRGRGGPRLASERDFLKGNRAPTPELMPGMDEDEGNGVRFKPIEDVSDSDEADMDLSEDENEQPKKKQAKTDNKAADGDSVPRWSNPDPYTALPPPDESQRKKKDVVKLIRKARVTANTDSATKAEADSLDFISFDDLDNNDDVEDEYHPPPTAPAGAPTGPRGFASQPARQPPIIEHQLPNRPPSVQLKPATHAPTQNLTQPKPPQGLVTGQKPVHINLAGGPSKGAKKNEQKNGNPKVQEKFQTDESLGNRKRNIRDEIKGPPLLYPSSKGKKPESSGRVVSQWCAVANKDSTPWIGIDHSDTVSMGFWLHKEIVDFYHFVKPKDFEQVIRAHLVEDLNTRVKKIIDDGEFRTFGSFPAGLYLPTADMDLVLISDYYIRTGRGLHGQSSNSLHRFGKWLNTENLVLPGTLEIITKAKVPLVKYVDKLTGLKVDVSFENTTGLAANDTFQKWKAQFPAMPMIVTIIKHLLAMRGLNEPVNGGIGGFSVICLVVSLLQLMPQVTSGNMKPEHHLNEVLMEFFDLYGNELDTTTTAIRVDPPGYISKARANVPYKGSVDKFMIIDPNNPSNDIAGGSKNTATIRDCFSESYDALQKTMASLERSPNRRNQSLLGPILAGNYESFKLQRDHLQHVYEHLVGPVNDA